MSNKLRKRFFIEVEFDLVSPLCVSNGDDETSDNDFIRYMDGEPFVPGSSIAGALRSYWEGDGSDDLFGEQKEENGQMSMSPVFISDAIFNDYKFTIRDGVELSEEKIAVKQHKFDLEVLDTGSSGVVRFELNIREKGIKEDTAKEMAIQLLQGVQSKDIAFGSKKSRGFGCVRVKEIRIKSMDKNNAKEFLSHFERPITKLFSEEKDSDNAITFDRDSYLVSSTYKSKFDIMEIPLNLSGTMIIRKYTTGTEGSSQENSMDYEHICAGGEAVIPGTSWAGALRHRMKRILSELMGKGSEKSVNDRIDSIFGYVIADETEREQAKKNKYPTERISHLRIYESVLEDSNPFILTRTRINRFTGGVKDKALFSERIRVGGSTVLVLKWIKEDEELKWKKGLLYIALRDLANGYLPVGGEVAIGRGIFSTKSLEFKDEEDCLKALYQEIQNEKLDRRNEVAQ